MNRFLKIFKQSKCNVIGMIHLKALPGTPKYSNNFNEIIEQAKHEAAVYTRHKVDSVLIENMHDVPYVQNKHLGPETVASMTRVAMEIKKIIPNTMPCGVQVLACGNTQALAVAKACGLQYIRAEGFVFGHIADEGYTDACAGDLLRYRRLIDAESVLVFTDLKKKHSSHSITADTSLLETAKAAEFFLTDGIILTGTSTGHAASPDDLSCLHGKVNVPLIIGSGTTNDNLKDYYEKANALIIGSHFKIDGNWANDLYEGYTDACAGDLLRYRRLIDAESVLVFTDLKKKHSSHSITADTSLLETAKAAEFFLTDGIILTGTSTGHAASPDDLSCLHGKVNVPLIIGSGTTNDNLKDYYEKANALIIGSHFKIDGNWANDLCENSIVNFMDTLFTLRKKYK